MVVMNTGHLVAEITEPGCHFYNCCNREIRSVSKKKQVLTLERCKLAEKTGNPMMISAVIVFNVVVPSKALMKVTSLHAFVHTQAQAVLRNIVSQYPFESHDGTPCLLHDSATVNRTLATALNHVIQDMGVICTSFSLDEISFAPEIASTMLQRQAAQALVDARKVIVHGAADLAASAVQALAARGINLTDQQRGKLLGSLLPVLCATDRDNSQGQ